MIRASALAAGLTALVVGQAGAVEKAAKPRSKTIDLAGHLSVLGEVATLQGAANTKPVLVDLADLPQPQRQAVTAKCLPSCDVRITGVSGNVLRGTGVIATFLALTESNASPKLASE